MFWERKYKKAFEYWQNKAPVHPMTCGKGCGNLDLEYIDENNVLHTYCKHCDYKQQFLPEMFYNYYKEHLKGRKLKVKPFFRWYDLWVGIFIDNKNDAIYIIPFPMFGIKIWWKYKSFLDFLDEELK